MHRHYCYYSALQVMMLQLPIASSKLPCSNALYNVKFAGDLNQIALRSLKALKGNFADARISFSIKARQQHWELRSLLVKKNYAMSSYLLFCVCASGTFVFIVISLGVCVCGFFSLGVRHYYSWHFQRNVSYSLSCSFVYCSFLLVLYIVFERPTTKSLQ